MVVDNHDPCSLIFTNGKFEVLQREDIGMVMDDFVGIFSGVVDVDGFCWRLDDHAGLVVRNLEGYVGVDMGPG